MKKTKRRLFLAFLGSLLLALAAMFAVACNHTTDDPKTGTATLTYVEGVDDATSEKTTEVAVGERLSVALSAIVPGQIEGLGFGGWFIGGAQVADDAVMPAEGVTVYAKYLADYTVNVYTQNAEGEYEKQSVSGNAYYGEAFTYDVQIPKHFENGEKPQNGDYADARVSTKNLGKDEVFTVYLARKTYTVAYLLNNGSTQAIVPQETIYGGAVSLANADEYRSGGGYRFDGWALTDHGDPLYAAGDELAPESDVLLYAVWSEAVTDLFGGSDFLFLSALEGNEDKIYLRREGIEEKCGVLNAVTGSFSFADAEEVVLDGKLTADGFYYYRDALNRSYNAFDGSGATLEIKAHGEAVYTSASGEPYEGRYELDFASGNCTFVSDGITFSFIFAEKGQELTYRTTGAEAGYYAALIEGEYAYDMFWFDGLGGLKYIVDPDEPLVLNGEEIFVLDGFYELTDKATATYAVKIYLPDGSLITEAAIRLSADEATFGDYTLKGTYLLGDDYAGTYRIGDYWSGYTDYVLDGFGGGSKDGKSGTYTVESSESWLAVVNGRIYEVAEYWIEFTVDGESSSTLLRFRDGLYGTEAVEITSDFGRYDFENALFSDGKFYNDGNTKAFLYLWGTTGNSDASLWIGFPDGDEWIYMQVDEGTIGFTFGGMAFNGIGLEAEFHFTFSFGDDHTVRYVGDDIVFLDGDGTTGDRLVIDTDGKAVYTPAGGEAREVQFTVEEGVLYFYSFELSENDTRLFVLENDNGVKATEITSDQIYDIAYNAENRQNEYTGRLIMLSESTAVVGILTEDGAYYYCYYGSVSKITDEDRYWFQTEVSSLPDNQYEDIAAEYSDFDFKTETRDGKNVFLQYDKAVSIDCEAGSLTTDGYGIATYTPKNGETVTGSYVYFGNYVIVEKETEEYRLRVYTDDDGNDAFVAVSSVDSICGYYYTVDEYGYIDSSAYLFIDGASEKSGTALMYVGPRVYEGTYEKVSSLELLLTFANTDGTEEEMYVLCVQDVPIVEGYTLNLFLLRDETQYGSFSVEDNGAAAGSLEGDGYFSAEYVLANGTSYSGTMVIGNLTDNDYSAARQFIPAADGNVIVFTATDEDGEQTQQFVFDLKDGIAVLRGAYGAYALEENGTYPGDYIYLDGHGSAVVYGKDGTQKDEGEYRALPEFGEGVYQFTGESTFAFFPYFTGNDGVRYAYTVYNAEDDGVYTAEGWSLLKIDGFRNGTYINRYGDVIRGTYTFAAEGLLCLNVGGDNLYFELTENTFRLIEGDFIVKGDTLYLYAGNSPRTLTMPAGVKRIAEGAFASADTDYLTTVDLNEVTIIEKGVFAGSGLETLISSTLLKIGEGAFRNCESLTRVEIPAVTEIGKEAFYGCNYLQSVTLGAVASVGANAFGKSSSYGSAVKFYVAEVNFAAAAFDETAFNVIGGGMIQMTLLVNDIDSLNAVENTEIPADWKNALRIASVGTDALSGNTYFGFAIGNVYAFKDGAITVYTKSGAQYPVSATRYLYYFVDEQGGVTEYSRVNGVWQTGASVTVSDKTVTLNDELLFLGDYNTYYNFTVKDTQDTLSFYLSVSCSEDYDDETLWNVTVQVNYAEYNDDSVTCSYDTATGKITFALTDGVYSATVLSGTECEITKTAQLITLSTDVESPTYNNPRYSVTFLVTEDGDVSLSNVRVDEGDGYPYSLYGTITKTAENTFSLTTNYYGSYTVVYIPAQDGQSATVTVTKV